ncbi:hypothetical protein [Streptomyces sp. NPDC055013]
MSDQTQTQATESESVDNTDTTPHEWIPPTREEWEGQLAKTKRANGEAASRKRWLLNLGYDPKTGQKIADGVESDDDETEASEAKPAVQPAQVDAGAIEKAVAAKTEAIFVALAEAGVGPKSLTRVSKMIDKTGITIGENGIEGLSEQIDSLKEELPELFKRSRATSVADASAVGAGKKQTPAADQSKDFAHKLAENLLRG